jgi:hypothetical protein
MAIYRVSMVVRTRPGDTRWPRTPTHDVTVCFAGCRDEAHAKEKARGQYNVERFKSVTLGLRTGE